MGDGSNLGITADRAISTILSGAPSPTEAEQQTVAQVRARVEAATPGSYGSSTDCITRAVLRLFEQHEETQVWPTERQYAWTLPNGEQLTEAQARDVWDRSSGLLDTATGAEWKAHGPDLYTAAKEVATRDELTAFDGCTGFMWGFAVNQARWILGQHPGSNPAIVTIEIPD